MARRSRSVTRRRSTLPPFQKKAGRYGTLYLFRIVYEDKYDFASPRFSTSSWAYDAGHAEDKFFDSDDQDWKIISIVRVRESH